MKNKLVIVIAMTSLGIGFMFGMVSCDDNKSKVDFLENQLAQKNLEYEWLEEIMEGYMMEERKIPDIPRDPPSPKI